MAFNVATSSIFSPNIIAIPVRKRGLCAEIKCAEKEVVISLKDSSKMTKSFSVVISDVLKIKYAE